MTETNYNLHIEILNFALQIENSVNNLLLFKLGIDDKQTTKNFGNKAGISFQSKIDLLYDIGLLNKDQHSSFELQMMFRNKFLHDISFTTFVSAVEKLDRSITKKLEQFSDAKFKNSPEFFLKNSYQELCLHNMKTCLDLYVELKKGLAAKKDYLIKSHEDSIVWMEQFFNLARDVMKICEESNLHNEEAVDFLLKISKLCTDRVSLIETNESINSYKDYLENEANTVTKSIMKF